MSLEPCGGLMRLDVSNDIHRAGLTVGIQLRRHASDYMRPFVRL